MNVVERGGFTISEFCTRNGISESFFFKLQKAGLGPRVSQHMSRKLITPQAEEDWHRAGEERAATSTAQKSVEAA